MRTSTIGLSVSNSFIYCANLNRRIFRLSSVVMFTIVMTLSWTFKGFAQTQGGILPVGPDRLNNLELTATFNDLFNWPPAINFAVNFLLLPGKVDLQDLKGNAGSQLIYAQPETVYSYQPFILSNSSAVISLVRPSSIAQMPLCQATAPNDPSDCIFVDLNGFGSLVPIKVAFLMESSFIDGLVTRLVLGEFVRSWSNYPIQSTISPSDLSLGDPTFTTLIGNQFTDPSNYPTTYSVINNPAETVAVAALGVNDPMTTGPNWTSIGNGPSLLVSANPNLGPSGKFKVSWNGYPSSGPDQSTLGQIQLCYVNNNCSAIPAVLQILPGGFDSDVANILSKNPIMPVGILWGWHAGDELDALAGADEQYRRDVWKLITSKYSLEEIGEMTSFTLNYLDGYTKSQRIEDISNGNIVPPVSATDQFLLTQMANDPNVKSSDLMLQNFNAILLSEFYGITRNANLNTSENNAASNDYYNFMLGFSAGSIQAADVLFNDVFKLGYGIGYKVGFRDGYSLGYANGYSDGYANGYSNAWAAASQIITNLQQQVSTLQNQVNSIQGQLSQANLALSRAEIDLSQDQQNGQGNNTIGQGGGSGVSPNDVVTAVISLASLF